jgi:hypothetical protein
MIRFGSTHKINHANAANDIAIGSPPDTPNTITIAYLLLVHRYPQQFKRLFKAIYHEHNFYLIHVDKKADHAVFDEIKDFLSDFSNTHIKRTRYVNWGGYSMVQSELDGIKLLLGLNKKWDFFINLSGQDFPLKTQKYIKDFLYQNRESNFIKAEDQTTTRPDTLNRIDNYFKESQKEVSGPLHKRPYMKSTTPYIGGQWMILTRKCCAFISESKSVNRFKVFYSNTLIPDESFFQTVLMNTDNGFSIINDDKRAIIWIPDGNIKLRPKTMMEADLDFLLSGNNLFARKFDESVDSEIITRLEYSLQQSKH